MMTEVLDDVFSIISRNYGPEMRLVVSDNKQYIVGKSCPAHGLDLLDNCVTLYVAQYFASDLKDIHDCLDRFPELVFEQETEGRTKVLSHLTVFSKEERRSIVRVLQDLKPFFRKVEKVCSILSRYIEVTVERDYDGTLYREYEAMYSSWEDLVDRLRSRLIIVKPDGSKHTCLDTQRTLHILHTIPEEHRNNLRLLRY